MSDDYNYDTWYANECGGMLHFVSAEIMTTNEQALKADRFCILSENKEFFRVEG